MCMYGIHPAEQTVTVNNFTEDSAMLQWIASPHVAAIGMPECLRYTYTLSSICI